MLNEDNDDDVSLVILDDPLETFNKSNSTNLKYRSISDIERCPIIENDELKGVTNYKAISSSYLKLSKIKKIVLKCTVCDKLFKNRKLLNRHRAILKHSINCFVCTFCKLQFRNQNALLKHEIFHTGDTRLQCKTCKVVLSSKEKLEKHIKTHKEKPVEIFKCEVCGKDFSKSKNLKLHHRLHTGYKPFHCKICDKTFSHCSSFTIHKRMHTGERPFECRLCHKNFPQSSNLITHMKSHATQLGTLENVKTHLCGICGKLFSYKTHLIRHLRIHTGERPYECKICQRGFAQSGSLAEHMRVHTGERPFKCEYCGKDYTQSGGLMQHIKKHKTLSGDDNEVLI